ncbi:MAG: hypothetical protein AMXMBFR7_14100 [Planctomycetota bacterium]
MSTGYAVWVAVLAGSMALGVYGSEAPEAPKRFVYGWFPKNMKDWSTQALDWPAITHLCFRSVVVQPDGTIKIGGACSPEQIRALRKESKEHGVKLCVLVWGTNKANSDAYLARHTGVFAEQIAAFVKEYELDGVNLDDETWHEKNSVTGESNREAVTALFKQTREQLDKIRPGLHLSYASPPVISAEDKFGQAWMDYRAIAAQIDHFTIMSYCMTPPTIGWTGSAQAVRGGGKVGEHPRDYATLMEDYLKATGGAKEKLMLGIDLGRGGTEWTAAGPGRGASIVGKPRALSAAEARANAEKHGRKFDPEQQAPYYEYRDGEHWIQGWYEDEESFAAKLKLARDLQLPGVCLWVLDGVAEPESTWKGLKHYLTPMAAK